MVVKEIFGDFWTARNPVDFWTKWNPSMHAGLSQFYQKLGGIYRPVTSTMSTFLINGVAHDVFFSQMLHLYEPGAFTLFFAVQGIPVVMSKCLQKQKAKKRLREDLDSLVERYEGKSISGEILAAELETADLTPESKDILTDELRNYGDNIRTIEDQILRGSKRYWRLAKNKDEIENPTAANRVKRFVYPALTTTYVIGTLIGANELIKYVTE